MDFEEEIMLVDETTADNFTLVDETRAEAQFKVCR
jgi:hypothetical protein